MKEERHMKDEKDRHAAKPDAPPPQRLPVTAEVGGEGGSYADATVQVETFSGPAGNPRIDQARVGTSDAIAPAADEEGTATGKPATEPPERSQR